jgi:hypothetical protein
VQFTSAFVLVRRHGEVLLVCEGAGRLLLRWPWLGELIAGGGLY